jgi:hypothetical protein
MISPNTFGTRFLFLEDEAVLCRAGQLLAANLTQPQAVRFLDDLAGFTARQASLSLAPATRRCRRRDGAGNGDQWQAHYANDIVTFNTTHLEPAARFGIEIIRPDEVMRR